MTNLLKDNLLKTLLAAAATGGAIVLLRKTLAPGRPAKRGDQARAATSPTSPGGAEEVEAGELSGVERALLADELRTQL